MRDSESLLRDAENALRSFSLRAIAVSQALEKPYTDAPDQSPWSRTIGPEARRAHDLARDIRKHLGEGHRMAICAIGSPPLTGADALREAVAALHMAGIKTGAQYEQLASEVIAQVYGP